MVPDRLIACPRLGQFRDRVMAKFVESQSVQIGYASNPSLRSTVVSALTPGRAEPAALTCQSARPKIASTAGFTLMIGQTLRHYRITEQIGRGGMGVVYRARDEHLSRDVAIKVLPEGTLADETARKRFRKEAEALSKLNHGNIQTVHDFDTQDGVDFLVMEFIPGTGLNEKLTAGALTEKDVARLGMQLAEGLAAAHEQGVLHRDLKPGNLRVMPDGRLKILDFGLAKLLRPVSDVAATETFTETQAMAGTLAYMAPEQLHGEPADKRSDIYAAGVVLYEMATGQRPFRQELATRLTDAILHEVPPAPSSVNHRVTVGMESIILKCLDKEPERRYQSPKELRVDLERLSAGAAVVTAWARPRRLGRLALAGVLAALLVVVGYYARQRFWPSGKPSGRIMLAVLPFENMSGDPSQEYFSDGLTEEMIAQLGRLYPQRLGVIARTSTTRYKKTSKGIDQIGHELGVGYVLEGSVRRAGDRVRITAQLIQVSDQTHLWAENYERDARDLLALQSDVAARIGNSLAVELLPSERARLANVPTINPEAHEAYLKGLSFVREGKAGAKKSLEYFEQAIQLDPSYAAPYSGQARAYHVLAFMGDIAPAEAYPKAKAAAIKALKLDDTSAEAHAMLALALTTYDWNWADAEREFRRALELNPSHAGIHDSYSHYLMAMGREEESLAEVRRAVELDPASAVLAACLGWHSLYSDIYGQAVEQSLKALQIDPNNYLARFNVGQSYEHQQKYDEAIAAFQNAVEVSGGRTHALAGLAYAYGVAGKRRQAEKILADLKERAKKSYVSAYEIAAIHTALGDKEQAFAWLDKAYQERSSWLIHLRWEPRFQPLRSDPRFQELLRRIGLPG